MPCPRLYVGMEALPCARKAMDMSSEPRAVGIGGTTVSTDVHSRCVPRDECGRHRVRHAHGAVPDRSRRRSRKPVSNPGRRCMVRPTDNRSGRRISRSCRKTIPVVSGRSSRRRCIRHDRRRCRRTRRAGRLCPPAARPRRIPRPTLNPLATVSPSAVQPVAYSQPTYPGQMPLQGGAQAPSLLVEKRRPGDRTVRPAVEL